MSKRTPRAVVISRPTPYELLIARHGTHGQARFFLESRDQSIEALVCSHGVHQSALHAAHQAIPTSWRRTSVDRADLDRFLFEPEDIVLAVGQDGLVANASKYLSELLVIGINPSSREHDGILVKHPPEAVPDLLEQVQRGTWSTEDRTMVRASVDGAELEALNEIFIGHRSHQSARYVIRWSGRRERQSSSGVIVSTGTGSTGWARSITRQRFESFDPPTPTCPDLSFFVREAFPSVSTGVGLDYGCIQPGQCVEITSEMNEGGVVFGDGIEDDRIAFDWGRVATLSRSERRLRLVL